MTVKVSPAWGVPCKVSDHSLNGVVAGTEPSHCLARGVGGGRPVSLRVYGVRCRCADRDRHVGGRVGACRQCCQLQLPALLSRMFRFCHRAGDSQRPGVSQKISGTSLAAMLKWFDPKLVAGPPPQCLPGSTHTQAVKCR